MSDSLKNRLTGIFEAIVVLLSYLILPSIIMLILRRIVGIEDLMLCDDLTYIIYLIPLCYYYRKTFVSDAKIFKKDNYRIMIKYYLIGIGIMIISNLIINFVIFDGTIAENESLNRELLSSNPILGLILAGILAPLLEELTFRRGFKNICNNKWIYVFITAFIFAFLHVSTGLFAVSETGASYIDWIQLVYLIPYGSVGVAFALTYKETENFYSNLLMHMIHNTATLLLLFMIN